MTWVTWGWFLLTETLLDLSPGPAVLAVTGTALRFGARRSLLTTAGILTANAAFFGLSAAGLGATLLASHASSHRARQVLDRASGVMLIGAGVGIALAGE
jgi:threonine/homoserine/homoserine lactone efflux protein